MSWRETDQNQSSGENPLLTGTVNSREYLMQLPEAPQRLYIKQIVSLHGAEGWAHHSKG